MAYKLIYEDEALDVGSIVVIIFGDPGTGKSSLAFTADDPICLDFDKGLQRAVGRKLSVKFDNWPDALDLIESKTIQEEGIKTIIADTAGTMLDDYIAAHILKIGGKGIATETGALGLKGFGVMKDICLKFFNKLRELKIDIVFVCHSKKENDGDTSKFFPQMTGGSFDILLSKADLVGYVSMVGEKATLDFNPTSVHTGKNCAGFAKFNLPHFTAPEWPNFLGKIISETKAHMRRQGDKQVEAMKKVEEYKDLIIGIQNVEELKVMDNDIQKLSPIYKAQVLQFWGKKYAELWAAENMDSEHMKTPEDFDRLGDRITALPKHVQSELRDAFKALMEAVGVRFDGATKKYALKADNAAKGKKTPAIPKQEAPAEIPAKPDPEPAKVEAPPAKPTTSVEIDGDLLKHEEWFLNRVGKTVMANSEKFNGPMTITDADHATHLFNVNQNMRNYVFSDMPFKAPTEQSIQQEFDNQPEPNTVGSSAAQ